MRTLVISDTHLTLPFEEKKFRFLEHLIKNVDQVIINGDFWDGYLISFNDFINSPWKGLFPLLKEKNTVYLFGNHDKQSMSDERIKLFSEIQTEKYRQRLNGKTLVFEHGHQYLQLFRRFDRKTFPNIIKRFNNIERILIRHVGMKYLKPTFRRFNRRIKIAVKDQLKENELFVCGHTHCLEVDYANKFINTGFVKHGLAQYLIIDDHDLIFKEEWYG